MPYFPPDPAAPPRILFAAESPLERTIAQATLSKAGYAVDVAVDGAGVFDALARQAYALLIVDAALPETGAAEVLAHLRDAPRESRPPLVLLGDAAEISGLPADTACTCLHKPFDPEVLLEHIARCLAHGGAEGPHVRLDLAVLRQLQADLPPGMLSTLMPAYIREAEQCCTQIEAALAAQDADKLRYHAHALKSNAAAYGLGGLSRLATDLENAARGGELTWAQSLVPNLRPLMEASLADLSAYIGRPSAQSPWTEK